MGNGFEVLFIGGEPEFKVGFRDVIAGRDRGRRVGGVRFVVVEGEFEVVDEIECSVDDFWGGGRGEERVNGTAGGGE